MHYLGMTRKSGRVMLSAKSPLWSRTKIIAERGTSQASGERLLLLRQKLWSEEIPFSKQLNALKVFDLTMDVLFKCKFILNLLYLIDQDISCHPLNSDSRARYYGPTPYIFLKVNPLNKDPQRKPHLCP